MKNRDLDARITAHPIRVTARRKEAFLADLAGQRQENEDRTTEEEGITMTKKPRRWITVLVAATLAVTMLVSAVAMVYHYGTPDGDILDSEGHVVTDTAHTVVDESSRSIRGDGYAIPMVTWTEHDGATTLSVWVTADSEPLTGLTAVFDTAEYPLIATHYNLGGNLVGYTATDVPAPREFTLRCDSPRFTEPVSFYPEDVIPATAESGGLTLIGKTSGRNIFLGVNDAHFLDMEIFRGAEIAFVNPRNEVVTDNMGNTYSGAGGQSARDGGMLTEVRYDQLIPADRRVVSMTTPQIGVIYNYGAAADLPDAESLVPCVRVPVPEDGETIDGEWVLIDTDGLGYVINTVSRTGDTIFFISKDGLTYDGERAIDLEAGGSSLLLNLLGHRVSGGGGKYETDFRFDEGELATCMNADGTLTLCLFELSLTYTGEWTLDLAE